MTPDELTAAVLGAVRGAVADGEIAVTPPDRVPIRGTPSGGFATPLPLRLARAAGRPAHEIAAALAARLTGEPGIVDVAVTGPGFLTVTPDTITPGVTTPGLITPGAVTADTTTAGTGAHGISSGAVSRGAPAARAGRAYGVITPPPRTWPERPLTFDNPGFVVRFAYARACAVLRQGADLGIAPAPGPLDDPRERRLAGLLAEVPGRAERAVAAGDVAPLVRYLERVAPAYHDVHERCPALPKGDESVSDQHAARLSLAETVRVVVGDALRVLGETPNDRL